MLQHVALETRRGDVEAEVAFWQLLGFTRVAPPPTIGDRATWLQSGPTQIHLLHTEEPKTAGHVAVVAPEFAETVAALEAAGHPTDEPPLP